ncbi:hypothetical protein MJD09_23010 [bacterium]|nr:hypothetical protein [bacterium]
MNQDSQEKKNLKQVEDLLRNGKPSDTDLTRLRYRVWQHVLNSQRQRRKPKTLLRLPSWIWALASIMVILLGILVIFLLK